MFAYNGGNGMRVESAFGGNVSHSSFSNNAQYVGRGEDKKRGVGVYIHIHTCIRTYICMHIHTHIHTHAHTRAQMGGGGGGNGVPNVFSLQSYYLSLFYFRYGMVYQNSDTVVQYSTITNNEVGGIYAFEVISMSFCNIYNNTGLALTFEAPYVLFFSLHFPLISSHSRSHTPTLTLDLLLHFTPSVCPFLSLSSNGAKA
jgi:hypothetical protein